MLKGHQVTPQGWAQNSTTLIPVAPTGGDGAPGFGDASRAVAGVGGGMAIVDGAHRLAAAAVFNRPLLSVRLAGGGPAARWDAAFFRSRGLSTPYLDHMASTWLNLHGNAARIFLLWPSATSRSGGVEAALGVLRKHGEVVYERPLTGLWDTPTGANGDGVLT